MKCKRVAWSLKLYWTNVVPDQWSMVHRRVVVLKALSNIARRSNNTLLSKLLLLALLLRGRLRLALLQGNLLLRLLLLMLWRHLRAWRWLSGSLRLLLDDDLRSSHSGLLHHADCHDEVLGAGVDLVGDLAVDAPRAEEGTRAIIPPVPGNAKLGPRHAPSERLSFTTCLEKRSISFSAVTPEMTGSKAPNAAVEARCRSIDDPGKAKPVSTL